MRVDMMAWRAGQMRVVDDVAGITLEALRDGGWQRQGRVLGRGGEMVRDGRARPTNRAAAAEAGQGLTLVQFSAQPKPSWLHLRVSPSLIDWGEIIMRPTYPTKYAYVELKSEQV